jgi:hypothetical protein
VQAVLALQAGSAELLSLMCLPHSVAVMPALVALLCLLRSVAVMPTLVALLCLLHSAAVTPVLEQPARPPTRI